MFKGLFKLKDVNGQSLQYMKGDSVIYQGRIYQCSLQTKKSPLQAPDNWKYTGSTETFLSENPPLNPQKGQIWISSSAKEYIWYEDQNGFQWIEI